MIIRNSVIFKIRIFVDNFAHLFKTHILCKVTFLFKLVHLMR